MLVAALLRATVGLAAAMLRDSPPRTLVGADAFVASGYAAVRGRSRVGVIADPTSVLPGTMQHLVDRMHSDGHLVNVSCVFGPEHGFRGDQQDGRGEASYNDSSTGLTVYNTYGVSGEALSLLIAKSGVDALVFDIQDVGSRYYTFIWTMYDMMVAAATVQDGFPFIILDRPNPIGAAVRGPMLHAGHMSFVGRAPIPTTHGMTVGELGELFGGEYIRRAARGASVRVTVVRLRHYTRTWPFERLGLPWVLPSPNMPTIETARAYPGTCLLEATSLSEGRGTTRPFNIVGAPFLDWKFAAKLRARQRAIGAAGVLLRETFFIPTFSKHAGNLSAGVDLLVTDPMRFEPIRTAVEILVAARAYAGFAWRVADMDRLSGSNYTRLAVDAGASADEILAEHARDLAASGFEATRRRYLIGEYGGP